MVDKIRIFLRGMAITALVVIAFYFGSRRADSKLSKLKRDKIKAKLDDLTDKMSLLESERLLATPDKDKQITNKLKEINKERSETLKKLNEEPKAADSDSLLNALRDAFDE